MQYRDSHPYDHEYRMEIKAVPTGDAPIEHRRAWVGLVLPFLQRNLDGPEPTDGAELVSDDEVEIADGYATRSRDAIEALIEAGRLAAAHYFNAIVDTPLLVFEAEEVRIVPYQSSEA